ncbi:MAG: hypothetical protein ACI8UG_002746 [Gammaproteobacteria bacterium]
MDLKKTLRKSPSMSNQTHKAKKIDYQALLGS